ncbi:MAG: ABC transporter ATP-binding protein [Sphaerobacteraceae bacterium]|nr:MAG: ABC transporter ATP-binding protein [Sphaerobacteraceae bacterium]
MSTEEAPLLSVKDLQTHFFTDEGLVRAVDGVTFDIHRGKTLGVVGESGCGKSVTARSLMRIIDRPGKIVGGSIMLRKPRNDGSNQIDEIEIGELTDDGREIRSIRGESIGLVFQEPMTSFSPVHTIGNQIIEAIQLHRPLDDRAARNRATELLTMVGVSRPEERLDELPFQMSGGLRQRAMIAMALACEPDLLIADEPTTALDVTTQSQILELLQDLQEENGMAVMLITHNLGVIAEMADDVVVMYLGQVAEKGTVDEIFYAPKHPYTKALLQSIPNIYQPSRVELPTISGSIPHPYNRPAGCPFHPRCPEFMPGTCDVHVPETLVSPTGQHVRCFLYTEGAVRIDREEATAGKDASQ